MFKGEGFAYIKMVCSLSLRAQSGQRRDHRVFLLTAPFLLLYDC